MADGNQLPVLVAGAGPTGLVLALSLARHGVRCRVIDAASHAGEQSRAMAVQARTLEFYRQFGFADEIVQQGVVAEAVHLREGGREVLHAFFRDMGAGISPYPFVLTYPQDDHERFLERRLADAGVQVERDARLTGFTQDAVGVRARVSHGDGQEEDIEAAYLCGCDGAHSQVRQSLQMGFPGGTYEVLFYVADVKIAGEFQRDAFFNLGEDLIGLMFPVRSSGMQRLIGLVPQALAHRTDLTFEDLRTFVEPLVDVKVEEVNWFSTYHVHHRVAEHFRAGRAFLLGDAGHVHSPAGGQGMNTGIGDAINLGWKLAQVVRGAAGEALLDSYEVERIGFARQLVATTDRLFTAMVAKGVRGELTRRLLAPLVLAVGTRFGVTRHAIFRTVSQTQTTYRRSPISDGTVGTVQGGDRLPWAGEGTDNFAPLRAPGWQMHVYGSADDEVRRACGEVSLPLHEFSWGPGPRDAGLRRDAGYLVRPDGYVGMVAVHKRIAEALRAYVQRHALQFA